MIHLKTDKNEAGLTTFGACLTHFRHNGHDILRPNEPFIQNPLKAACFPCAPYFGRIPNGVPLSGDGFKHQTEHSTLSHWPLSLTHKDIDTPIHGEAWVSPWQLAQVEEQNHHQTILSHHAPANTNGKYPFGWQATKTITLNQQSLSIDLTIKNTNAITAPFGLGLHPFFQRLPDTQLQFDYETLHTPPAFAPITLDQYPFPKKSALPDFTIDHSFIGWGGRTIITTPDKPTIMIESNAAYLHLYAPQGQNFFCLEPVTQLPGAFSSPPTLKKMMLEPQQSRRLTMTISCNI